MDWNFKQLVPVMALTMVGLGSRGFTAARTYEMDKHSQQHMDQCAPEPAAPCYSLDECPPCGYCLGPEMIASTGAVRPFTCNGDIIVTIAGFYWKANQDGLTYAVNTSVPNPSAASVPALPVTTSLNTLINAEYLNPKFKWDLGFKLGLGYNSTHDGWDIGAVWTNFHGKASAEEVINTIDNQSLLPLWSDFSSTLGSPTLYANHITSHWKLKLNLIDIEMGREFWNSKYLTLRPHMGLRFASLKQTFDLLQRGGTWGLTATQPTAVLPTNDAIALQNKFKGVGLRSGLESTWHLCQGFSLFGNAAMALVYGRFNTNQEENTTLATTPFSKSPILQTSERFRSSKAMTDLAVGLNWSTMFYQCKYRFTAALAWEHHLFFNQNQLWRVTNGIPPAGLPVALQNPNTFSQSRGDLSTQGWTLTGVFDF